MIEVKIRRKPDRQAWQLYYIDPLTGTEKTRSAKTDSLREAERAAQRWQDELEKSGPASNISWDGFRDRFEAEVLIHRRDGTRRQYDAALDHFERIVGHPKRVASIAPSHISEFQGKLSSDVAPQTVAKTLRQLKAALNWAEHMGMTPRAPKIVMPKLGKRRLARARAITEAEYAKMLLACKAVRPTDTAAWRRLLELLWLSGFRLEEALRLSWDSPPLQVDLTGGRYPRVIFFAEGQKSDSDELWVMPPDLHDWLERTPEHKRTGLVAPVLFAGVSDTRASHIVTDIGRAAEIETSAGKFASAQDFRRAFGTRWARKVRPLALQKLMRHATLATTQKFYVDTDESAVGEELWGDSVLPDVRLRKPRSAKPKKSTPKNKRKKPRLHSA